MENTPVKACIIGCGRIGTQTSQHLVSRVPPGIIPLSHAEAILANPHIELAACCDTDPDRLDFMKKTYGISQLFTDYKTMIKEIRPDIVSVATRTAARPDIMKFLAENGVRALHIEKPISRNMKECNDSVRLLEQNNVGVTYGTSRRFMDIYKKAKEIVNAGEIGEMTQVIIEYGKTLLMWNHPHSIDLMLFFSSCTDTEYVQATCEMENISEDAMIADCDPIVESALVKFRNGVTGLITTAGGKNTRIAGTKGVVTIAADGSFLKVSKLENQKSPYFSDIQKIHTEVSMSGTERAFHELYEYVANQEQTSVTTREIQVGHNILMAIAKSSLLDGRRIALSDVEDDFCITGRLGELYA